MMFIHFAWSRHCGRINGRLLPRRRRAVTLIEIMLASVLAVMVLAGVYRVFSLGARVGRLSDAAHSAGLRQALVQMRRELRGAYLGTTAEQFLFQGTSQRLRFVSTAPAPRTNDVLKYCDARDIEYSASSQSGGLTYRWRTLPVFAGPPVDVQRRLMSPLYSVRFSYFDGKDWRAAWQEPGYLPRAVRISVQDTRRQGSPTVDGALVEIMADGPAGGA